MCPPRTELTTRPDSYGCCRAIYTQNRRNPQTRKGDNTRKTNHSLYFEEAFGVHFTIGISINSVVRFIRVHSAICKTRRRMPAHIKKFRRRAPTKCKFKEKFFMTSLLSRAGR